MYREETYMLQNLFASEQFRRWVRNIVCATLIAQMAESTA